MHKLSYIKARWECGVWACLMCVICLAWCVCICYDLGVWVCVVWWACLVWTYFFGVCFLGNIVSNLFLSNSHFFNTSPKGLILSFRLEISILSISENFVLYEILYASKSFCVDMSVEDKSSFSLKRITILFWRVSFSFFYF